MKNKLLIGILLLPAMLGHTDGDTYESTGLSPQFVFEINQDNVVGAIFEAGLDNYYRGNLTYAAQGNQQNWFKFSAEYLLEHQNINFIFDPRKIWVDQYAAGATYQFFPTLHSPIGFLANTYGSYTPSADVNAYQKIDEALAYGGNIGMSAFFPTRTQLEASLRYDIVTFHQTFAPDDTEQGFGGSGFIKQYFGCGYNAIAGTDMTAIYNNYYAAFNVLFPISAMQAFQIGLRGQYNDPHDDLTRSLIGLITFGLQPQQECDSEIKPIRETFASFASRPAIYMPTVLAKADEAENDASFLDVAFIPNNSLNPGHPTYDISVFFSDTNSEPLTYVFNQTQGPDPGTGQYSFNGTTGVFSQGTLIYTGTFSGSVTATNRQGQKVKSNVFTVSYKFA